MSARGYRTTGVVCISCNQGVPLSLVCGAMTERDIENLPDPFKGTCPKCNAANDYQKCAIRVLEVE